MRIALITTSYPSAPGDPSGHFVATEARELARTSDVVVFAPGRGCAADAAGGPTVRRYGGGAAFGWPGAATRVRRAPWLLARAAAWAWRVRAALEHGGPWDRVVAHWAVPSAWPIAPSGELDVVSHGADVRLLAALPAAIRARIVEDICERASRWRFVSAALQRELDRMLPPPTARALEVVSVIQASPIDIPDVRERAEALRAATRAERLYVCAGRLVANKRFDHAFIRAGRDGASVVVLGDGPERGRLEALARTMNLDVRFLGITPRDEALAWIRAADGVVHASSAEGLSTVVREADALGTPVLLVS